jgi:Protein of unknown function (DUF2530)
VPSQREPPVDGAADRGTAPTAESRPPAALDPPMVPFAVGGIIVWAIVGLALLPFRDRLDAHGHGSWLAICLAGFLWGFVGLAVMVRHDARRRRRRANTADDAAARRD